MTDEARDRLADAQAALVHALVGGGEAPPGFDATRIARQAAALRSKRRRVIARLRPDVELALGDDFGAQFDVWAHAHPQLTGHSASADADEFAAWLVSTGQLPKPARSLRKRTNRTSA